MFYIYLNFSVFQETGPGFTAVGPNPDPSTHSPALLAAHQNTLHLLFPEIPPCPKSYGNSVLSFVGKMPTVPLLCGLPHDNEAVNLTL